MRTIKQIKADLARERERRDSMKSEAEQLHRDGGAGELRDGAAERFELLTSGIAKADSAIQEYEDEWKGVLARIAENPANLEPGDGGVPMPGDSHVYGDHRGAQPATPRDRSRDDAVRAIEQLHQRGDVPDHAAERARRLVTTGTQRARSLAAEWVVVAGADAYARAFAKLVGDPERGHLLWDRDEQEAFRRVQEYRAMNLTDGAGGFMVPLTLDPAILLTSDGSINPLRQISRVEQTATDTWRGVTSAGVTSAWYAEAAEVTDDSPTLQGPEIPVHRGSSFVPFSFEVGMDAVDLVGNLREVLLDSADQLQATAYTTGTGAGQPTGIITALPAASLVAESVNETFTSADVYKVQNAARPRFQARAQWAARIDTLNKIAQFETANGARLFPEIGEGALLRKPAHELSNMKGADDINPAVDGSSKILLYGDFQAGFVIVDRIGSTLELIPNLLGANRRPTGERGAFLWFRTGSDVVIDNAFRLLDVTTSVV